MTPERRQEGFPMAAGECRDRGEHKEKAVVLTRPLPAKDSRGGLFLWLSNIVESLRERALAVEERASDLSTVVAPLKATCCPGTDSLDEVVPL